VTIGENIRDQNSKLIQRYFEDVLSGGRLDVIVELMRPDLVFSIPTVPGGVRGIRQYQAFVRGLREAFPDAVFSPTRKIVEETRGAAFWTFRGTHRGPFLGVPATGKVVTDEGIDVFHFADGRVTDVWANEDAYGLMRQLGVLPAAESTSEPARRDEP
jgi:steroid delta-isomerase-like uncharacterized protein